MLMIILRDVIITIGLIGNVISFIVFSRNPFRKSSTAFYCKCLSLFNSFTTYQLIFDTAGLLFGENLKYTTKLGCHLLYFISGSFSPIPTWILIYFSLDQMLAVRRSKQINLVRKRKFQLALITTTVACHILLYLPIPLFFIDAHNNPINGTKFPQKCEIKSVVLMPYVVTYFSEAILAPFFAMTITTSVILKSLWSSRRNLKRQEPSSPSSLIIIRRITSRKRRERKYWINSVGLNVVFVLLMSPLMASLVIPKTSNHKDENKRNICLIFFYLSYTLHFWTHLCVNVTFRNEFFLLIGYVKPPVVFYGAAYGVRCQQLVVSRENF